MTISMLFFCHSVNSELVNGFNSKGEDICWFTSKIICFIFTQRFFEINSFLLGEAFKLRAGVSCCKSSKSLTASRYIIDYLWAMEFGY